MAKIHPIRTRYDVSAGKKKKLFFEGIQEQKQS